MVLPFDVGAFLTQSVHGVEIGNWEARFWRIWNRLDPTHRTILNTSNMEAPFGACNEAMLVMAQKQGESTELLTLWDGRGAAKCGGTAAFVERFQDIGGHVTHVNSQHLLAAMEPPY
jgi:hypothetical protein